MNLYLKFNLLFHFLQWIKILQHSLLTSHKIFLNHHQYSVNLNKAKWIKILKNQINNFHLYKKVIISNKINNLNLVIFPRIHNLLKMIKLWIFNKNKIVWQTCSSNDKLGDFWDGKTRFSGWNDAAAEVVVENVANVGEGDGDGDGDGVV